MEFERQAEIMDMKEEMMNDAIDDAMGDEEDEEERCGELGGKVGMFSWSSTHAWLSTSSLLFPSDAVVSQVLDELGLSLTDELSSECYKTNPQTCHPQSLTILPTLTLILPLFRPPLHWRLT